MQFLIKYSEKVDFFKDYSNELRFFKGFMFLATSYPVFASSYELEKYSTINISEIKHVIAL